MRVKIEFEEQICPILSVQINCAEVDRDRLTVVATGTGRLEFACENYAETTSIIATSEDAVIFLEAALKLAKQVGKVK